MKCQFSSNGRQLVSEFAIEWLYVAILPLASLLNGQSLHLQTVQPDRQCPGSELGPIVRADMLRHSPEHEELEQLAADILRGDTTIYRYCRTHPGIFVDYGRMRNGLPSDVLSAMKS